MKFTTPLLVPSFSSKGFPPLRDGKPWVARALETTSEWLTDMMLISAYDIHYGYIPDPTALACTPELTIVDSGGYEVSFDDDLSAVTVRDHEPRAWSPEQLAGVLDKWPQRFAAMFVSYDHPKRRLVLADQVAEAKRLFARYPQQLHSLLLKPETREQEYLQNVLKSVADDPGLLAGFHAIGVTEKELGSSLLQRMQRLAELRLNLDAAGISAPIQVFGALDPVTSCMYFIAGAEIFDGLTWLRYAYHEGMCVYRANYGALHVGLDRRDELVSGKTMTDNLNYLRLMEASMRRVAHDQDVRHFLHHRELLQQGFDDLRAKMKGRI
ncbi:hypothetical protein WME99_18840 [Sorangium sp. So ce136]|uniref:hypothetical protein n=1 Tax=Sorangium sp. So ce136 TaxID=3133284 RepID=UPI003F0EEDFC